MKDIFIDNNIACRFSNPMDPEMVKLINWLVFSNKGDKAILVVSKKLLEEYCASSIGAKSETAIPSIINTLIIEGRLNIVSKQQIEQFKNDYFSKARINKMRSNAEDRDHIPVVLLSDRKYALTNDSNFTYDLNHFPGFTVLVSNRPELIPYGE